MSTHVCGLHIPVAISGILAFLVYTSELLYIAVYPAMLTKRYGDDQEFVVKAWMMVVLSALCVFSAVWLGALSDRTGPSSVHVPRP